MEILCLCILNFCICIFLVLEKIWGYHVSWKIIRKWFKMGIFLLISVCAIVIVPASIVTSYAKTSQCALFGDPSDLLNYFGTCISALGTVFLGAITLHINKKFEEENIQIQKKLLSLTEQANLLSQMNFESRYPYFNINHIKTTRLISSEIERIIDRNEENIFYSVPTKFDVDYMLNHKDFKKIHPGECEVDYRRKVGNSGCPKNGEYIITMNFGKKTKAPDYGGRLFFRLVSISDSPITALKLVELEYLAISGKGTQTEKAFLRCDIEINGLIHKNDSISLQVEVLSPYKNFYDTIEHNQFAINMNFEVVTVKGQTFKQKFQMFFSKGKILSKEISPPTLCLPSGV